MYFGSKLQIEPSFNHAELKECSEGTVDSACDKTLRCGELKFIEAVEHWKSKDKPMDKWEVRWVVDLSQGPNPFQHD